MKCIVQKMLNFSVANDWCIVTKVMSISVFMYFLIFTPYDHYLLFVVLVIIKKSYYISC